MEGTLQTVSELTTQTPFYIEHLDAIVTMLVTIIGFVVTYLMTKKNFKDEVKKNKIALASDQIQTLPYDICQLMDAMIKGENQQGKLLRQPLKIQFLFLNIILNSKSEKTYRNITFYIIINIVFT